MLIETNYIWGSQFLLIRPAIGNLMFLQIVSAIKSFCNIYMGLMVLIRIHGFSNAKKNQINSI